MSKDQASLGGTRAHLTDVCAKLLSFTRAINYPNNIKENEHWVQTRGELLRGAGEISLETMFVYLSW